LKYFFKIIVTVQFPQLDSVKRKMSAFPNQIEYFENYKTYGGFKYHLGFPDEWILNELPNTGRECANCVGNGDNKGYAMWRGIVLGYCVNCAITYCGTRCKGFNAYANEWWGHEDYESAYDKYLGEIDLENYGDLEANPDDKIEMHLLGREGENNSQQYCDEVEPYSEREDECDYECEYAEEYEREIEEDVREDEYKCESCCWIRKCYVQRDGESAYCEKHREEQRKKRMNKMS